LTVSTTFVTMLFIVSIISIPPTPLWG
jgi:hypothetical protein